MTGTTLSAGVVQTMVTTTTKLDTKPAKVPTKPFSLRDIPHVMRDKLNWPIAARLQERWFDSPAFEIHSNEMKSGRGYDDRKSAPVHLDESTIKMDWVLNYPRAFAKYMALEKKALSDAAIQELTRKLVESGIAPHRGWTTAKFGQLGTRAAELDETCQCNYEPCLWGLDAPVDELLGALGDFTMKVAAGGTIRGKRVTIERVGFYIRDTFEFMDEGLTTIFSQPLGMWGPNGIYQNVGNALECVVSDGCVYLYVDNRSYRDYRKKYGKGGDFIIYSDVLWKNLRQPRSFVVSTDLK